MMVLFPYNIREKISAQHLQHYVGVPVSAFAKSIQNHRGDLVLLMRRAACSSVPPSAETMLPRYQNWLTTSIRYPLIQIGKVR